MERDCPIRISRRDTNGRALIAIAGELDLESAPLVRESLARCLREGNRVIDLHLGGVTFCDCAGFDAILDGLRRAGATGARIRLHRPSPAVTRLIALTGLGGLLPDDGQSSQPIDGLLRGPPQAAEPPCAEPV